MTTLPTRHTTLDERRRASARRIVAAGWQAAAVSDCPTCGQHEIILTHPTTAPPRCPDCVLLLLNGPD